MSDARETPSTGPQGCGRPDDAPGRSGADEPTTADDLADRDVPAEPDEPVVVAPAQVEPVAAAGPVTADRARTPEDGEQQPTATSSPADAPGTARAVAAPEIFVPVDERGTRPRDGGRADDDHPVADGDGADPLAGGVGAAPRSDGSSHEPDGDDVADDLTHGPADGHEIDDERADVHGAAVDRADDERADDERADDDRAHGRPDDEAASVGPVVDVRADDHAWNDAVTRAAQASHDPEADVPLAEFLAARSPRPEGQPDDAAPGEAPSSPAQSDVDPTDATVPATERPDDAADVEPSGWAVLARAMAPRANRSQLIAGVLCALLGFALVVQVRQNDESALSGLRQSELVRVLDETTERGDELRREVAELRGERDDLESGSDRQAAAIESLRRSAITQGILSGRLPAEGPGVRVTLNDPDRGLQPVAMLNMLEELRNAGAEAIQLNDRRVTASSSFTGTRGRVLLDGVELTPPYVWLAIGDPSTLSIALQIPGGAMATVRGTGATGTVQERDEVSITALRQLAEPSYATPAPPDGG